MNEKDSFQEAYNTYKSLDGPERVIVCLLGALIMVLFTLVIAPLSILASESILISTYTYISIIITVTSIFLTAPLIAHVVD